MEIRLELVNRENWEEASDLAVSEDHERFVAPNLYSIAEAQFYDGVNAYVIYNEEEIVGFTLYGAWKNCDEDSSKEKYPPSYFWIWRFMITEGERFKGYGKEAMKIIINKALEAGFTEIYLSTEPCNDKAIKFYQSLGFVTTGVIQHDEEVFRLKLR